MWPRVALGATDGVRRTILQARGWTGSALGRRPRRFVTDSATTTKTRTRKVSEPKSDAYYAGMGAVFLTFIGGPLYLLHALRHDVEVREWAEGHAPSVVASLATVFHLPHPASDPLRVAEEDPRPTRVLLVRFPDGTVARTEARAEESVVSVLERVALATGHEREDLATVAVWEEGSSLGPTDPYFVSPIAVAEPSEAACVELETRLAAAREELADWTRRDREGSLRPAETFLVHDRVQALSAFIDAGGRELADLRRKVPRT